MPVTAADLKNLVRDAEAIIDDGDLTWEARYHLIFNKEGISGRAAALGVRFDYYDPDTGYKEDARAYVTALREHLLQ